jgi:hypothetical protein
LGWIYILRKGGRRMMMEERWKFRATRTTRVAGGKGAAAALGERGRTHGWESCEI